ncbi:restriction endonuclease subunit S [Aeromonas allosaccharophila]|uniref:restriction endonuclease subunit S n=1 Tax=Aeromonas allosaccharophila TaxID=656 RepID=UPI0005AB505D|nr:restriction endonuclease subunit S [Aeromonas allosaccharophila]
MTWRDATLGDVITLKRGYDLPNDSRIEGDIPVVSSSGITGYHNEAKIKAPAVVTGRYGTLGEVYYVEQDCWPLNTALYVKDFKGNRPKYVHYFLKNILRGMQSDKAAVPGVNRNDLHARKVIYAESDSLQKNIEDLLSPYDELIDNNLRRIKLLEDTARLLFKEWFLLFRFPGHEYVKISNGLPEGWTKEPLENLLILQRGFDLPVDRRKDGDIPIIASTGVNGYHNEAKVSGPGVVTGRSGSLGTVMYISKNFWPLNTALWVKEFKKVSPIFATFLLRSMGLQNYNGGAAVPTLNRNDVHKVEVVCPDTKSIEAFDEYVNPVFKQIELLEEHNKKLSMARDLLLPRLMNGDITV